MLLSIPVTYYLIKRRHRQFLLSVKLLTEATMTKTPAFFPKAVFSKRPPFLSFSIKVYIGVDDICMSQWSQRRRCLRQAKLPRSSGPMWYHKSEGLCLGIFHFCCIFCDTLREAQKQQVLRNGWNWQNHKINLPNFTKIANKQIHFLSKTVSN